jgi:NADH dehydrogenase FAD-containing subunit
MARRMTLEGAKVHAVCEIMPHSSGLKRNIVQCLDDFDIPLYLSHTIVKIEGKDRVTGVVVAKVDENKKPIKGTEIHFDCDTVLFSVGLIPENELSKTAGVELSMATKGAVVYENRETNVEGVFACGNVLQVHDLVDFVSEEAEIAGRAAADYVLNGEKQKNVIETGCGANVSYVLPQKINKDSGENVKLFFRVNKVIKNCTIKAEVNGETVISRKKKIAVPGEMESVLLLADKLKNLDGKITVSVEGETE